MIELCQFNFCQALYLADWAKNSNSLLIVTWNENDFTAVNHIATIFYGAYIAPGATYNGTVNHFDLLRTIENFYDLPGIGNAAAATAIDPVPEPSSLALLATGVIGSAFLRRRRKAAV